MLTAQVSILFRARTAFTSFSTILNCTIEVVWVDFKTKGLMAHRNWQHCWQNGWMLTRWHCMRVLIEASAAQLFGTILLIELWWVGSSLNGFPRNKGLTIQAAIGRDQSSSRLLPFLGGLWHFLVSTRLPGISVNRDWHLFVLHAMARGQHPLVGSSSQ